MAVSAFNHNRDRKVFDVKCNTHRPHPLSEVVANRLIWMLPLSHPAVVAAPVPFYRDGFILSYLTKPVKFFPVSEGTFVIHFASILCIIDAVSLLCKEVLRTCHRFAISSLIY